MANNGEKIEQLLSLVRDHFPEWNSFSDERFLKEEISYKRNAVAKAEELLNRDALKQLVEKRQFDEIISRLDKVGHATNLLWTVVPMSGDLSVLYQRNLDKASFCSAIIELIHGSAQANKRLEDYSRYLIEHELPNKWTFPTYFLFLCHPNSEIFIKPSIIKWFLDLIGASEEYTAHPSASCYMTVKNACEKLKHQLGSLGARDMVDIQGFVYVAASVVKEGYDKKSKQNRVRYWKVSPGENAWNWDACRVGGFIAIGWDELGDLSGLSKKEFDARWAEVARKQEGWAKTPSNQVWNFVNLKEGDKIVANDGTALVLGLGVVTGEYYFIPGTRHGHRVPVDWYDVEKRPVKKEGWRKTMVRLSEEEFQEIEISKLRPGGEESAGLFSSRCFELLEELHANPTQEFYRSKRDEFKQYVEGPMQRVMRQVSERLSAPMLEVLEIEKKIFGRIPKNDWGKGGTWDFYWGAFYPKGSKRIEDAQLFIAVNRNNLRFGFSIGSYGSAQRSRLISNLDKYRDDLFLLLKDILDPNLKFSGEYSEKGTFFTYPFADWIKNPKSIGVNAAIMIEKGSAEKIGERQVIDWVSEIFRQLFPFVILATSDDPMSEIREYLETGPSELQPEYSLSKCAEETGISEEELSSWVRAIERKKQAILYGPPGTGKTYVAEKLALHLIAGGTGFMDILQFHPAYAYEDFMQGIRPRTRQTGGLEYPIVEGRFMEFCREARAVDGRCVLIIDEINRANLSRVFGELMYLLEYRNAKIPLAAGGEFQIPANVRILGTMNTADRSIALVDHALRRRFAFIPLYPNYEVLRGFHEKTGFDSEGLISVLKRLNSQIGDRHYEVGITFFLRDDIESQISDVWRMEIEPYLEEYFFDQRKKADEFRWEQVRKEILPEGDY